MTASRDSDDSGGPRDRGADTGGRMVVLVDSDDNELGQAPILDCHVLPGRKHRAFTALVFDDDGRILLARRAAPKMLWPGFWDATVASHPHLGESHEAATRRRLREEIGVVAEHVEEWGRFEYRAPFEDVGAEDEVCATVVARLAPGTELVLDPAEVSAVRWETPKELMRTVRERPEELCPWAFLALLSLADQLGMPPEFGAARDELERGTKRHFPEGNWRLLGD